MTAFVRRERYCGRVTRFAGVVTLRGTRLKRYDTTIDGGGVDEASYARGIEMAGEMLPREAVGADRPGVGVLICHTGKAVEYVVMGWWDHQNELVMRVLVRDRVAGAAWRDGAGEWSFCVWDLEVMWHEREAYVQHVLSPAAGAEVEEYLLDVWDEEAEGSPAP